MSRYPRSSDRSDGRGNGGGAWNTGAPMPWWRRVFGSENPLQWSLPLGRYLGITVRVSLLYAVWMALELVNKPHAWMAIAIATGFVLVLLHEFGHCLAARRVGGEADDILMWPLGGLASVHHPHTWRASFITTACGPLVNLALVPVLAGALLALGQPLGVLVFNPFKPSIAQNLLDYSSGLPPLLVQALFWAYFTNWVLLLFNVLVPMFPMDGGRMLQALLWRKMGYERSMDIATRVGLGIAVLMGMFALVSQEFVLFGIAVFGGLTCFHERQNLKFRAGQPAEEPWAASARLSDRDLRAEQEKAERAQRQAQARRQAEAADALELDRILAKIKAKGMGGLTKSEEAFLRRTRDKMAGR